MASSSARRISSFAKSVDAVTSNNFVDPARTFFARVIRFSIAELADNPSTDFVA
jgi:hypothetical protein